MNTQSESTRTRSLPWYLWAMCLAGMAIIWLGIAIAGSEERMGNAVFGLLITAILVNASVVASQFTIAKYRVASQVIWLVVAVSGLVLALLIATKGHPDALKNADTILLYVMFALAFPVGFVVALASPLLYGLVDVFGTTAYLVSLWLILAVAGYLQWFQLLPRFFAKRKNAASVS